MDGNINSFYEILKITLPALVVFLTAYFLFRDMLENNRRQREFEFRIENQGQVTPIRLQAYERLTMFLERISPQSLLTRTLSDISAARFHYELLKQIRQEYEHNLSQQIYVSVPAWEALRGAKESLIMLINKAADEVKKDEPAISLSNKIFQMYMEQEDQPVAIALAELKKEVRKLF
ncbi:hypothetical protein [Prolixibacter sp. SD074]|jgi:hypothetical protein|uniref:DUF7935 family protein n=1 Tax=Prolixibacter sp. SD074 TaxID=2652391 RepID=UPI001287CB30|nr:hypothetical protein [Prolixibacter sp. SD074]GET29814.1 hypothetical protein SD074_20160 [Prolixibacter sp. SD074]